MNFDPRARVKYRQKKKGFSKQYRGPTFQPR